MAPYSCHTSPPKLAEIPGIFFLVDHCVADHSVLSEYLEVGKLLIYLVLTPTRFGERVAMMTVKSVVDVNRSFRTVSLKQWRW
jgi:hypothetical protein